MTVASYGAWDASKDSRANANAHMNAPGDMFGCADPLQKRMYAKQEKSQMGKTKTGKPRYTIKVSIVRNTAPAQTAVMASNSTCALNPKPYTLVAGKWGSLWALALENAIPWGSSSLNSRLLHMSQLLCSSLSLYIFCICICVYGMWTFRMCVCF